MSCPQFPTPPENWPHLLALIIANQAKLREIDEAQARLAEIDRQAASHREPGRRQGNEQDG